MKDLSIVIPALNEPTVPGIVRKLYSIFGKDTEIIVVKKSNKKIERELRATGATVIEQNPLSYETAAMQGFNIAKNEILATIDADGTHDPADLAKAVSELRQDTHAGLVSVARIIGRKKAMTPTLRFGNTLLTKLFNLLYRQKMQDVLSGSFAMRKEAFDYIRNSEPYRAGGLFFEIEIARRGYKIKNVIGSYKPREGTVSRITKSKPIYGLTMAYHSIRYARDYNPLLIFGTIGLLAIIIGLIQGGFIVAAFIKTGTLQGVGRALVAFLLIILGFVSIIAGLILDMLLGIEKLIYRKR